MKAMVFLSVFLLTYVAVSAYMLYQRGLLTRETLDLFVKPQPEVKDRRPPPVEHIGLAASVQKKEQKLKEEADRLEELAARLEEERKELETVRALIEDQLKKLKSKVAPEYKSEEMVKLVKMFEGMEPEQAAGVLENLPDLLVAQILLQMRDRQAARVMGTLSANKAAGISKLLVPEQAGAPR